ncbi:AlbA family DNA-binding domain-containing protein [Halorussus halophilus]|uniref:AlbA family DNA-binding domain-containing protein n=1 Tax=Halorussus halophilus TaxID=2650975 RepID=UPI0013011024|nr:ATP-binding protein [Halorussus halophilus]
MVEIYEQEEASIGVAEIKLAKEAGRGEKTEFYAAIPEEDEDLAVTACSLANNGGGQILIGVDKTGKVIGLESGDVEDDVKDILDRDIERKLDRTYVTSSVELEKETILAIVVSDFKRYPLTADGRFYLRHQDEDVLLSPDEVCDLMRQSPVLKEK